MTRQTSHYQHEKPTLRVPEHFYNQKVCIKKQMIIMILADLIAILAKQYTVVFVNTLWAKSSLTCRWFTFARSSSSSFPHLKPSSERLTVLPGGRRRRRARHWRRASREVRLKLQRSRRMVILIWRPSHYRRWGRFRSCHCWLSFWQPRRWWRHCSSPEAGNDVLRVLIIVAEWRKIVVLVCGGFVPRSGINTAKLF